MSESSNFFDKCYEVARQIPFGRVTSYGAIATYLAAPRSARAVGYAMTASHGKDVPAHRVVNRKGLLTGKPPAIALENACAMGAMVASNAGANPKITPEELNYFIKTASK